MSIPQTITGEKHTLEVNGFLTGKLFLRVAELLFKTKLKICDKNTADVLRFEISSEKMNDLLSKHQICAADIRCLDTNSKQCLRKLCLKTCLHCTTHSTPVSQLLVDINLADKQIQIERL